MIQKIKAMIESFLAGNYDPLTFSFDLPAMIVDNYEAIESEDPRLAKVLDDTFPDLCDGFEFGLNPKPFIEEVKAAYEEIFIKY